jgi:phosphatidylglycerol:prolipoprotein diacylglycerol transferase
MLQTLFIIPRELWGVPLFVWLLGVWAIVSGVLLFQRARAASWQVALAENWLTMLITAVVIVVLPGLMEPEGLPIRGYGVMLLLAIVSGVGLSVHRARQRGIDPELILSLAMWLVVSGIIGGRLFYVIEYWEKYRSGSLVETLREIATVTKGGLVVYGALLAGGAALVLFVYRHKLPGLMLADLIVPGVVLGMAIGRVGCFLNGCCFGGACDLPWAVRFPPESPPFMEQAGRGELFLHGLRLKQPLEGAAVVDAVEPNSPAEQAGIVAGQTIKSVGDQSVSSGLQATFALLQTYGTGTQVGVQTDARPEPFRWEIATEPPRSNPIHPTQLYSAIDAGLLCLLLLAYDPFRRREGELAALAMTLHSISRFLIEVIRIDESAVFGTGLSISQNISIGVFIGGMVCWLIVVSRPPGLWTRKNGPAARHSRPV